MSTQGEKFYQSCPNCRAHYMYPSEHIDASGNVACQNCGRWMTVAEGSLEALPIEDAITMPVFSRRFLYGFAITMLLVFIVFIIVYSTLDLESSWWPPYVIIPIEPP